MNCDAQSLTDAARCIECGVPPGMQLPVLISLMCQIVNNGGGGGPCPACDFVWTPAASDFWGTVGVGVDPSIPTLVTTLTLNFAKVLNFDFGGGFPNLTTVNFAKLTDAGLAGSGGVKIMQFAAVTSIAAPLLVSTQGNLDFSSNPVLASVSLPSLQTVLGSFLVNDGVLTTLNLPAFASLGGSFEAGGNALVTVSIPVLIFADGNEINFDGNALNAASVNGILRRCVVSGLVSSNIILSGGTNAAPTGQGLVDKAALIAAGCTVTTN